MSIRRRLQEAVLRRWAKSPACESLLLRGGVLTGAWLGFERRPADDIDFVALYPIDFDRTVADVRAALATPANDEILFDTPALKSEVIFAESSSPGVRMITPGHCSGEIDEIQIDVAYNDIVVGGAHPLDFPLLDGDFARVWAPTMECCFAWKLHGLFEFDDGKWRPKDLADLWMFATSLALDEAKLREAIRISFESRDCPFWKLNRLVSGEMGSSGASRRSWRRWREENPAANCPTDLATVIRDLGRLIEPHWRACRTTEATLWPVDPTFDEMRAAVAGGSAFAIYTGDDGSVSFVYERQSSETFPEPFDAATNREIRRRQLLREARGLTFDNFRQLIARPLPKFFNIEESQAEKIRGSWAVEELDGSLLFVAHTNEGPQWRTRRGPSPIATAARMFAESSTCDYRGLIAHCRAEKSTPIFEWCSRSRRIVLDHPIDRLVLVGIRNLSDGRLLTPEERQTIANEFGIETATQLGIVDDPKEWLARVTTATEGEGCVFQTVEGELYKCKSERYRLLHRAVEGPGRDRARWMLLSQNVGNILAEVSIAREMSLEDYIVDWSKALRTTANKWTEWVAATAGSERSRKNLATQVAERPPYERRLCFNIFDGHAAEAVLRRMILDAGDETQFREIAHFIGGPILSDG